MSNKNTEPKFKIYDNGELHICISSRNGKLGNIPQFNTLPGNEPLSYANGQPLVNIKGTCGEFCKDCVSSCYAVRMAIYRNNNIIPAYGRNTVILRNDPEKVRREINEFCKKNAIRFFRFHSSGELESIDHLNLYCDICEDNPDIIFYIYTKRFDLVKECFVENNRKVPENLVINLSEWHGNIESFFDDNNEKETIDLFNSLNIFFYDDGQDRLKDIPHCPAIDKSGHETGVTCAQCRRCMKKGMKTAVYQH